MLDEGSHGDARIRHKSKGLVMTIGCLFAVIVT